MRRGERDREPAAEVASARAVPPTKPATPFPVRCSRTKLRPG